MADGHPKPIDQVDVGDDVVSTDPQSHATGIHTVVALHRNHDTDLTDLTVTDSRGHVAVLHTTQHHPFWDETANAWVDASRLRVGDHLHTGTDSVETVVAIRSFTSVHDMYNLTVDTVHTYYVIAGSTPVLVHNCPADVPGAGAPKIGPTSGSPNFEDGSISPGEGWEWRGPGAPGTPNRGAWYNPATKETLHPDLAHGDPIGPHYDYRAPDGTFYRIYPDGRVEPK
jgi:hypothetical protein